MELLTFVGCSAPANGLTECASAAVALRSGSRWTQEQKLTPSDAVAYIVWLVGGGAGAGSCARHREQHLVWSRSMPRLCSWCGGR